MRRNFLSAALLSLADFLYPPRCPECAAYVEDTGAWCLKCAAKYIEPQRFFFPAGSPLGSAAALLRYEGAARDLLRRLKFQSDKSALAPLLMLRDMAAQCAEGQKALTAALRDADFIVPVPLHTRRKKERGYNQAALLWNDFFAVGNIKWLDALGRTKETTPQYGLNRTEREQNVKGAFAITDANIKPSIKGKNIVLLDDIITTGATLAAAAHALKRAGASRVDAIALATGRN